MTGFLLVRVRRGVILLIGMRRRVVTLDFGVRRRRCLMPPPVCFFTVFLQYF